LIYIEDYAMLSDTHPEAEKFQLELIRQASPARRISLMRSLTAMLINLSRQGIAKSNPGMNAQEVGLRWAELNYGMKLASEVREYFKKGAHDA
jgi:hypothetical protein